MRRAALPALGGVVLLAGAGLLIWRWQGAGFAPGLVIAGLLLLVGIPSALWLSLGPRSSAPPRRLPRVFWIGTALLGFGALALLAGIATPASYPQAMAVPTGRHTTARFAPLPQRAVREFGTVFPGLEVGRALRVSDGNYEVWLRRPGARTYRLQATWRNGSIQLENLGVNAVYTGGSQTPPKGSRYAGYDGPVAFPGYDLYVSRATASYQVLSGGGMAVSGGAW